MERYRQWKVEREQRGMQEAGEDDVLDEVPDGEPGEGGTRRSIPGGAQFKEAAIACVQNQGGSTSLLQRKLGIGYGRAARHHGPARRGRDTRPSQRQHREVRIGIEQIDEYCA